MTNQIYYTGIGSRDPPSEIPPLMTRISKELDSYGRYILRSGGARGSDTAFELGTSTKEIFRPEDWLTNRFNNKDETYEIFRRFHPNYHRVKSEYSKALLCRNVYQVLGSDLHTPTKFIICWTEGGAFIGGTSLALRIGQFHSIPIFNLGITHTRDQFLKLLDEGSLAKVLSVYG